MANFDEEILTHAKNALIKLDHEGWLTDMHFNFVILKTKLQIDKVRLCDLNDEQVDLFVNLALHDAETFELLEEMLEEALTNNEDIPPEIMNVSLFYFAGKIQKPRKQRSNRNDARDFSFLALAEVLSRKFNISVSKNDSSDTACAFTYIVEALIILNAGGLLSQKVTTTFLSLSRMRTRKPNVSIELDNFLPILKRQIDNLV